MSTSIANILTIAGSDSGGGAGIQADLKTIMGLGCYGMSVITALTAQNGLGVTGIHAPEPDFAVLQIRTVREGFPIHAAKTGMLFSAEIIAAIAGELESRDFPLVVDPVAVSQSGHALLQDSAVDAIKTRLIPICDLLTPNIPEAELLSGSPIKTIEDEAVAGAKLLEAGARAVLVKGGHMPGADTVTDCLCIRNERPVFLPVERIQTNNNHGTGCTLSAAIASCLGMGASLREAVETGRQFLSEALRTSYAPGKGCGPVNHFAAGEKHIRPASAR